MVVHGENVLELGQPLIIHCCHGIGAVDPLLESAKTLDTVYQSKTFRESHESLFLVIIMSYLQKIFAI